jgi:DNA-directed RNA polymerase subunit N (RpoN/RPB10)
VCTARRNTGWQYEPAEFRVKVSLEAARGRVLNEIGWHKVCNRYMSVNEIKWQSRN